MIEWIQANVPEQKQTSREFAFELMTAVLKEIHKKTGHSKKSIDDDERLLGLYENVLKRYLVDHKELQVEALFALQKHFHDCGYPSQLFTRYWKRLNTYFFYNETLNAWKESDDRRFGGKKQAMDDLNLFK